METVRNFNYETLNVLIKFDNGEVYNASTDAYKQGIDGIVKSAKFNNVHMLDRVDVLGALFYCTTDIEILDISDRFRSSEIKGQMRSFQKVEVYVESELLFTYRTSSWVSSTEYVTDNTGSYALVKVGCFDRLKSLESMQINNKDIVQSVSLTDYILGILKAGGINEEDVVFDDDISYQFSYSTGNYNSVYAALNDACQSNLLQIYCDKNEKVHVKLAKFYADISEVKYNITMSQILPTLKEYYVDNGESYDGVQLIYSENKVSDNIELLKEIDHKLEVGENSLLGVVLDIRCAGIDTVHISAKDAVLGLDDVSVNYTATSDMINIVINSTKECSVNIKVYGRVMVSDARSESSGNNNRVAITNSIIQNKADAEEFVQRATEYIQKIKNKLVLDTMIGFDAKVGDIVRVTSDDGTSGINGISSIDDVFIICETTVTYAETYQSVLELMRLN